MSDMGMSARINIFLPFFGKSVSSPPLSGGFGSKSRAKPSASTRDNVKYRYLKPYINVTSRIIYCAT
jgi:hypothetical protein